MCTSFLALLRLLLALSLIHLHQQHRPSGCSLCLECCSPRSSELASYCLWSNLSYSMRPTLTTLLYTTVSYLTSSSSLSWLTLFFFFSWHLLASNMPYNLFVTFIVRLPQKAGKLHEVRDLFFFFWVTDLSTVLRTVLKHIVLNISKKYEVLEINTLFVLCFYSLKKDFLRV